MAIELAIIGAGNMAEAIARGLIDGKVFSADQLIAADVSPERRKLFADSLKIKSVDSPIAAARDARRVLLSVKPQNMQQVLAELKEVVTDQTVIISIAAGISTKFVETNLAPRQCRVIRTMPNTPMLVGQGMVAMAPGSRATSADLADAKKLFSPAATVIDVTEDKLDAVTALSGSGPAYFFFLVEQMVRAGVEMGLSPTEAHTLATKTALGAATMLATSMDSPQELRRKVTSPKGTTHEAITYMEEHQLPQTIVDALKAAQRRSRELGS